MERVLVEYLKESGLDAQRVPLSGSAGGRSRPGMTNYGGDVEVVRRDGDLVVREVKRLELKAIRGAAKTLRNWMGTNEALVLVTHHGTKERFADHPDEWLVVLHLGEYCNLIRGGEGCG